MIERASSIQIQACFDSAWARSPQTKKPTSGATLSLWGVPLAASSRTQATSALSTAEAELYAMGMAINDALHLKSLLQEMKLSQLAKPVELTVCADSSSGKALASKLGLTRKSKHVQLRYMFIQDLLATGQLQLSKIPAGKNHAAMLAKHLPASTLHKLLPKLGVRTRAAASKDLLSVFSLEVLASRDEPCSFFIGMMAEQPASAQLVASSLSSRACEGSSLQEHSQEGSTELSVSTENLLMEQLCSFAFCNPSFATDSFSVKTYSLVLCGMLSIVQLCFVTVIVFKQCASRTVFWTRA